MKRELRRLISWALAAVSAISMSNPVLADQSDFDYITEHIDLAVEQSLNIARPADDITVNTANYYITGTSDPLHPLYLDGMEVLTRGKFGSFGIYVPLEYGDNFFTFTNGEQNSSVLIIREEPKQTTAAPAQITTISSMFPTTDTADFYGNKAELYCIAPSGASVVATVKSRSVELKQTNPTAVPGIAAAFRGEYSMPDADGTVNLGPVTYTMTYNGSTVTAQSAGELITVGEGNDLVVQCTQVSAGIFREPGGPYIATAKLGAVDRVIASKGNHYQLSMGGWVSKGNVDILFGKPHYYNSVASTAFTQQDEAEIYSLIGTSNAFVQSWESDGTLYVNLFNTNGFDRIDVSGSSLFESAAVTQNVGGSTTIRFKLKPQAVLWGHTVKYDNGVIEIICKYPPQLTGNPDLPLEGITVALDAGHGIDDPGALGVAKLYGPTEAQINRATAVAVKKKLESMGAAVSLLDELEHGNSFNNRMQPALDLQADFFISLHCNSTVDNYNGTTANGAEVYYYETGSKQFAKDLVDSLSQNTGRRNRGNLFYEFRVILNSLAPSVLVEMGYMSNPADYDDLCSKEGIYNTAVAVSDAIISHLTPV